MFGGCFFFTPELRDSDGNTCCEMWDIVTKTKASLRYQTRHHRTQRRAPEPCNEAACELTAGPKAARRCSHGNLARPSASRRRCVPLGRRPFVPFPYVCDQESGYAHPRSFPAQFTNKKKPANISKRCRQPCSVQRALRNRLLVAVLSISVDLKNDDHFLAAFEA